MILDNTRPCPLGPAPPADPIRVPKPARLALEIEDRGSQVAFTERDPRTGRVLTVTETAPINEKTIP